MVAPNIANVLTVLNEQEQNLQIAFDWRNCADRAINVNDAEYMRLLKIKFYFAFSGLFYHCVAPSQRPHGTWAPRALNPLGQVFDPHESPMSGPRRADLTGLGVPRGKGLALPKSVEHGNLSLDKAVIRGTSSGGRGGASPQPYNAPWRVAGTREGFCIDHARPQ
jgi:hypothetical protein